MKNMIQSKVPLVGKTIKKIDHRKYWTNRLLKNRSTIQSITKLKLTGNLSSDSLPMEENIMEKISHRRYKSIIVKNDTDD